MCTAKHFFITVYSLFCFALIVLSTSGLFFLLDYPQLDDDNSFYISDNFGTNEYFIYKNNLFNVSQSIQESDIYIVGSSRSQFAVDEKIITDYFRIKNMKVYHLGFGFAEDMSMFMDLVKRYNIRDKYLLIIDDSKFFL